MIHSLLTFVSHRDQNGYFWKYCEYNNYVELNGFFFFFFSSSARAVWSSLSFHCCAVSWNDCQRKTSLVCVWEWTRKTIVSNSKNMGLIVCYGLFIHNNDPAYSTSECTIYGVCNWQKCICAGCARPFVNGWPMETGVPIPVNCIESTINKFVK